MLKVGSPCQWAKGNQISGARLYSLQLEAHANDKCNQAVHRAKEEGGGRGGG